MAKNDDLPKVALGTPPARVDGLRKDTHLYADGVWYLTVDCPEHGLVDIEVPWAEAKTPHHAGVIADQVHAPCFQAAGDAALEAAKATEIAAAEAELARVQEHVPLAEAQLATAKEAVAAVEDQGFSIKRMLGGRGDPHGLGRRAGRELEMAEAALAKAHWSVEQATQRLADIRKHNAG